MRLRHLVLTTLSLAAATLTHADADAQSAPNVTFDAVTSYATGLGAGGDYAFTITGVQHGASASSTVVATVGGQTWNSPPIAVTQTCERALLVMLNRPGRFSLGLYMAPNLTGCSLTQLP